VGYSGAHTVCNEYSARGVSRTLENSQSLLLFTFLPFRTYLVELKSWLRVHSVSSLAIFRENITHLVAWRN